MEIAKDNPHVLLNNRMVKEVIVRRRNMPNWQVNLLCAVVDTEQLRRREHICPDVVQLPQFDLNIHHIVKFLARCSGCKLFLSIMRPTVRKS